MKNMFNSRSALAIAFMASQAFAGGESGNSTAAAVNQVARITGQSRENVLNEDAIARAQLENEMEPGSAAMSNLDQGDYKRNSEYSHGDRKRQDESNLLSWAFGWLNSDSAPRYTPITERERAQAILDATDAQKQRDRNASLLNALIEENKKAEININYWKKELADMQVCLRHASYEYERRGARKQIAELRKELDKAEMEREKIQEKINALLNTDDRLKAARHKEIRSNFYHNI